MEQAATTAASQTTEQRLTALEAELDDAKKESKKFSALVAKAIADKDQTLEEGYKGERTYWEGRVEKIKADIAELRKGTGPATKCLRRDPRGVKDKFLAALPLAKLEENAMKFEREMYLTHDPIVFTRKSYQHLYKTILERVRNGGKCVTTGTPGIGKSFFGYFAVRRLLEDGFTVIHIDLGWDWTNLYIPSKLFDKASRVREILAAYEEPHADTPWMGRFEGNSQGLAEQSRRLYEALTALVGEVVVVLDPPKNFGAELFVNPECGLLVVTVPSAQRIASFNSFGDADNFYMPIWTKEELLSLLVERKGAPLSDQEEDELSLRFLRFGGIPRFIARPDCDHATMVSRAAEDTHDVVARLEGASMKDMLDPFNINPQYSGRIIHLEATSNFKLAGKHFATEMIERQILVRYWRRSRQELLTLVNAASSVDFLNLLCP